MLAKSLITLASAALTLASPLQRRQEGGASCASYNRPTLPNNGGEDELPSPAEGEVLKYILLGHGIQNYTCADAPDAEAEATGALAVLYDATPYYPHQGSDSVPTLDHFNALTTLTLWANGLPLNGDGSSEFGASTSQPFREPSDLVLPGVSMAFAGHHFFDADGVPTFHTGEDEDDADLLFKAKLDSKVPAPVRSDPGPVGTGAVAWLQLADNGASRGVSHVYRVVTAGGNPRACVPGQTQSVPYTTYYWFFGPEDEE